MSSFLSSLAEIAGCDDGWLYYCVSGSHGVCSGQRTTVTQLHCCWLLLHHCTGLHSSTLQPELVTFGAALARCRTSCPADLRRDLHICRDTAVVTGHRCDSVRHGHAGLGSPQHHDCARLLANWNYFPPLIMRTTKLTFKSHRHQTILNFLNLSWIFYDLS